ncbi:uncharacterized protein LOC135397367 [Ornithodoros turicata]|uniref:uncharacterized protein LOC135397367 n=1 Tax=Ornithodoros turicata TaxID=34597 RepID=UPI0031389EBB
MGFNRPGRPNCSRGRPNRRPHSWVKQYRYDPWNTTPGRRRYYNGCAGASPPLPLLQCPPSSDTLSSPVHPEIHDPPCRVWAAGPFSDNRVYPSYDCNVECNNFGVQWYPEDERGGFIRTRGRPALVLALRDRVERFVEDGTNMSVAYVRDNFRSEMKTRYEAAWKHSWDVTVARQESPFHYGAVLRAYALRLPNVCRAFNSDCRSLTARDDGTWADFGYKSFWWLLLEAVLYLSQDSGGPGTLYRGISNVDVYKFLGDCIIFGQFLSTSSTMEVPLRFANSPWPLILELRGVPSKVRRDTTRWSYCGHQEELLLPFCVFRCISDVVMRHVEDGSVPVLVLQYVTCLLDSERFAEHMELRRLNRQGVLPEHFDPNVAQQRVDP